MFSSLLLSILCSLYSITSIYTRFLLSVDKSMTSDNRLQYNRVLLQSRIHTNMELFNRTKAIPLLHSVTSKDNLVIPTTHRQMSDSKSLLFFSPDIHDGTMTDLAVSLTSQNHSIFLYNSKCALPAYTGLRSVTLSEEQYLQLSGINNKSRIIFASPDLCKKSKLFAYNMTYVNELWSTFQHNSLFKRVDAIICMFYPSDCQSYIAFNKTVIFMPANRFLI